MENEKQQKPTPKPKRFYVDVKQPQKVFIGGVLTRVEKGLVRRPHKDLLAHAEHSQQCKIIEVQE